MGSDFPPAAAPAWGWPRCRSGPRSWAARSPSSRGRAAPRPAGPQVFPELTEREREILQLIGQGRTNEAIAERLVLSLKTVRNHVSNICGKLQVADRAQAVIRAREAGLG